MNLRKYASLLPALAAMSVWYVVPIRDLIVPYVGGEDPYRSMCMALTAVQWYSVLSTGVFWSKETRVPTSLFSTAKTMVFNTFKAWTIQNAWEYAILFQIAGNRRLDLYPLQNLVILEDARLTVAALSLILLYSTLLYSTNIRQHNITYRHNIKGAV